MAPTIKREDLSDRNNYKYHLERLVDLVFRDKERAAGESNYA